MKNWFSDKFRRHLADMHIHDWDDMFLSKFSEDDYLNDLLTANVQVAMIYMQSHIGLCYFPTKVSKEHRAFKENNRIKKLMEKCRAAGIAVVGYYSLIFNHQAYLDHPDWRMINERGKTVVEEGGRGGLVCPNNADYRAFVVEQIREFSSFFPKMEGVFFDMPFWPVRCMCESCRKRFLKETGYEIPKQENWGDSVWRLYVKKRQEWMAEFSAFATAETKKLMPGVTVSQNFAGAIAYSWWAGSTEGIGDACEYVGGDLYGDLYNHSFACKYYLNVTKNSPFEYMLGSCEKDLSEHTVFKTESKLTTEVALTAAHHGATMFIDAIDLDGRLHKERYERFGKIFAEEKKYEPYLCGEHLAEVAVYYDTKSQFSSLGYDFNNKNCAVNLVKTFIKYNIASAVIANGAFKDIGKYKMIFAPALEDFGNGEIDQLIEYVRGGGTLYISSAGDPRLLKELFGAKIAGLTESTRTYLRPTGKCGALLEGFAENCPMAVGYALPLAEGAENADVLARLTLPMTLPSDPKHFASFHSNPPGIDTQTPVMLKVKYGKGTAIWCAAAIEQDDRPLYRRTMANMVYDCIGKDNLLFDADCSEEVELVAFKNGNAIQVSLVDLIVEERKEPRKYRVGVKAARAPKSVTLLPDGEPAAFEYKDGRVYFGGEFTKFRMIKIEF